MARVMTEPEQAQIMIDELNKARCPVPQGLLDKRGPEVLDVSEYYENERAKQVQEKTVLNARWGGVPYGKPRLNHPGRISGRNS